MGRIREGDTQGVESTFLPTPKHAMLSHNVVSSTKDGAAHTAAFVYE